MYDCTNLVPGVLPGPYNEVQGPTVLTNSLKGTLQGILIKDTATVDVTYERKRIIRYQRWQILAR
jgi:hypothetical protein